MLGARDDGGRVVQTLPLIAPDIGARQCRTEVRVLPGALGDPPPPRVARDVHHRRKGPSDALARCLPGRIARRLRHQVLVPARGQAQGNRKERAEAVNHIEPKQDRHAQPRPLDRLLLIGIRLAGGDGVEDAAHPTLPDKFVAVLDDPLRAGERARRKLVQLADLFLKAHLPEQGVDPVPGLRRHEVCALRGEPSGLRGPRHQAAENKDDRGISMHYCHLYRGHGRCRVKGFLRGKVSF